MRAEGFRPEWARKIEELAEQLGVSHTGLAEKLSISPTLISGWIEGSSEPVVEDYIQLGNLAEPPSCWYFWDIAGLCRRDLRRVVPELDKHAQRQSLRVVNSEMLNMAPQNRMVAIPLYAAYAAADSGAQGGSPDLQHAEIEEAVPVSRSWCENPVHVKCLYVEGNAMAPVLEDGWIIAVDSSLNERSGLGNRIVLSRHKEKGLRVSWLKVFGSAEVLVPQDRSFPHVIISGDRKWEILGTVIWWIGKTKQALSGPVA